MCKLTWLKHQLDFCNKMIDKLEKLEGGGSDEDQRYLALYNKQKDIINYYIKSEKKLVSGSGSEPERKLRSQWYEVEWLESGIMDNKP